MKVKYGVLPVGSRFPNRRSRKPCHRAFKRLSEEFVIPHAWNGRDSARNREVERETEIGLCIDRFSLSEKLLRSYRREGAQRELRSSFSRSGKLININNEIEKMEINPLFWGYRLNTTWTSTRLCKGQQLCMTILGKLALFVLSVSILHQGTYDESNRGRFPLTFWTVWAEI